MYKQLISHLALRNAKYDVCCTSHCSRCITIQEILEEDTKMPILRISWTAISCLSYATGYPVIIIGDTSLKNQNLSVRIWEQVTLVDLLLNFKYSQLESVKICIRPCGRAPVVPKKITQLFGNMESKQFMLIEIFCSILFIK